MGPGGRSLIAFHGLKVANADVLDCIVKRLVIQNSTHEQTTRLPSLCYVVCYVVCYVRLCYVMLWLHVSPCGLPTYVNYPLNFHSHGNCQLHFPSWIPSCLKFGSLFLLAFFHSWDHPEQNENPGYFFIHILLYWELVFHSSFHLCSS